MSDEEVTGMDSGVDADRYARNLLRAELREKVGRDDTK